MQVAEILNLHHSVQHKEEEEEQWRIR